MVMDPRDDLTGMGLINKVDYLALYNEPDYSYEGYTPITAPATCGTNLQQFFNAPHEGTTYLTPGLANGLDPNWFPTFNTACGGCMNQKQPMPILSMHLYNPKASDALGLVTQFHNNWPEHDIWITEFAPGIGGGCDLDEAAMIQWMKDVFNGPDPQTKGLKDLTYVKKVFWNCGESSDSATCNPSLTDDNGNARPLLTAYRDICGETVAPADSGTTS